ncbi:MAG: radical SAM protein [Thermodesulfovibrionaceae bacterium]
MIFVRVTGCNLRCSYCDTKYAYYEGVDMEVDEIIREIKKYNLNYVEITGGEPLLQEEVYELIDMLVKNYNVLIETNGSVSVEKINPKAKIIMDIKTPGSGMSDKNLIDNLRFLKKEDEIKFVLTNKEDYEWAKDFIKTHKINVKEILFSPAYGMLSAEELAKWILKDSLTARLNLQLHKYIFGNKRGV